MSQRKPRKKLMRSFLKRHDVGMDAAAFEVFKDGFGRELSQVTNIHQLNDYYRKTREERHPALAKYSRLLIRIRAIELIETMDYAWPPDWFWELIDEKRYQEVPHFMAPVLRAACEKVLTLDSEDEV